MAEVFVERKALDDNRTLQVIEKEEVVQSELMRLAKEAKSVLYRDENGRFSTTLHNADQIIDELERRLGKSLRSKKELVVEEKEPEIVEEKEIEQKINVPTPPSETVASPPESFFTQESQRIRNEWSKQKQDTEASILSLPPEEQANIINRMLEIDAALNLAFDLGVLHTVSENMTSLQEEVQQILEKAAEEAVLKNLEAAPTVVALKKPGPIDSLVGWIRGSTPESKRRAVEILKLGTFLEGLALNLVLTNLGVQPEAPMALASILTTMMVGMQGVLWGTEQMAPIIEAKHQKVARSIKRVSGGHSIAYLSRKTREVIGLGFPLMRGIMLGGLLSKSFSALADAYHLNPHHGQIVSGESHDFGSVGGRENHHGSGETTNEPQLPLGPPKPIGPPRPPVIGEPISKSIYETVPTNGTMLSQHENNFLHGLFPGYEHVQVPSEYHNGVLNMLKNLDIAVSKRLGIDAANPSDGLYRLLDRIDAVKAVDVYVDAVQKLPKDWTIGQLDDPQYGLSEYQKILLRAGAGGQYLSEAELSEVINMLEKVK